MRPMFAIRLAWRNIWRQKRRTLITAMAIAAAMLLSLFMRSMQEGSYAHNLDNATRAYSGYLQLQEPEFSENQSIDKLLPGDDGFVEKIHTIQGITTAVPRIESFALGAAGDKSKGVIVMGVAPEAEDAYSGLADRVKQGRYFERDNEEAALVGSRLADYFKLSVDDELVLYGQGYHGTTAAGVYTVAGIIDFPNQQLNARLVYLPLKTAQELYLTGNQVTAWALHGKNVRAIPAMEQAARAAFQDGGYEVKVRNWADISPEMAQQISMDRVSGQFMVFVLYGVVGFGLFATIVMMTLERRREFAVMLATGMVRTKLQFLVMLETLFIAMTGAVLGLAVTTPILVYLWANPIPLTGDLAMTMEEMGWEPIIPFSLAPEIFAVQVAIVLLMVAICLGYPLFKIYRLQLAPSLKGQ